MFELMKFFGIVFSPVPPVLDLSTFSSGGGGGGGRGVLSFFQDQSLVCTSSLAYLC